MGAPGTLIEDPSGMTAADKAAAEAEGQKTAQAQQGVWAPLSGPTFRMLWLIWMAANTCMWMNDVAGGRVLTSPTPPPRAAASVPVTPTPFAVPAYERLGFRATSAPLEKNGVAFVPMQIALAAPVGQPQRSDSPADWIARA